MVKRIVAFAILFIIVCMLIGSYSWIRGLTTKTFISRPKNEKPLALTSIQQYFDQKVPLDIAFLGYGGADHDGPYLTDSMMLVHIDIATRKIYLISIPRDTWVKLPINSTGSAYGKINSAYAIGLDNTGYPNKPSEFSGDDSGGKLAEYAINEVSGLPVQYFVGLDFAGFTKSIDTLGGVDIDVEPGFDDYAYPIEDIKDTSCGHSPDDIKAFTATVSAEQQLWDYFPCRYRDLHFNAGLQHMDGATALAYVRSRHSLQDGTDFGRSKRQRNLLVAMKQKIMSVGFISKIIPFVSSLGNDSSTDMKISDLQTLIAHANELSDYQVESLALTDQNYLSDTFTSDGQFALMPKSGQDSWNQIHTWLSDTFKGIVEPVPAMVLIENGTHTTGLALQAYDSLQNQHIGVAIPQNAVDRNNLKTSIVVFDKNTNTNDLSVMKNEFPGASFTYQEATPSGYNVLVTVGSDYVKKTTPTPSPTTSN
ncbi:MAG TPA: LCP family protein [Patescibacteria group bacterium]|nr:LCP family protein [Patescibacteria group bacterium]